MSIPLAFLFGLLLGAAPLLVCTACADWLRNKAIETYRRIKG